MARRSTRVGGFTLIEMATVIVIISITAALAGTSMYRWKQRSTSRGAALEFYLDLTRARQKAIEQGSDVWVLIYPTINTAGATSGRGAYFVWNDPDMTFQLTSGCPTGQRCVNNFSPPLAINATAGRGALESATYLDDYAAPSVSFAAITQSTKSLKGPFANLVDSGCSFCSGTPSHGAVVFTSEGTARFVDGAGVVLSSKTAALGFRDTRQNKNSSYVAITRSTGFIAFETP